MISDTEERLHGGNVATVWRAGDTVRRNVNAWTANSQALLKHVRARGLASVPRPLGYDEQGREVLSFIPGVVPQDTPSWLWANSVLDDAARLLRQWHDATADYVASDAVDDASLAANRAAGHTPRAHWGLPPRTPAEVICHNDFAPYNCVFREQRLVGVIDFDACAPGPRLWDIAYALYRFVPLMPPASEPAAAQSRFNTSPFSWQQTLARLQHFLSAYAAPDNTARYSPLSCVRTTITRLRELAAWTERRCEDSGDTSLLEHVRAYRAHASWLDAKSIDVAPRQ